MTFRDCTSCTIDPRNLTDADIEIYADVAGIVRKFLVTRTLLHLMVDHGYAPQAEFVEAIFNSQQIDARIMRSLSLDVDESYTEWYQQHDFVLVGYLGEIYERVPLQKGFIGKLRGILKNAEGFSEEN